MPGFKQSSDLSNLLRLFHRVDTNLSSEQAVDTRRWYLSNRTGGVFIDAFTELFEDLNGGAYLDGCGCLHGHC